MMGKESFDLPGLVTGRQLRRQRRVQTQPKPPATRAVRPAAGRRGKSRPAVQVPFDRAQIAADRRAWRALWNARRLPRGELDRLAGVAGPLNTDWRFNNPLRVPAVWQFCNPVRVRPARFENPLTVDPARVLQIAAVLWLAPAWSPYVTQRIAFIARRLS